MQLVKLVKHGNSVQMTIPVAYLRELNWAQGDRVVQEITPQGRLEVHKLYEQAWHIRPATELPRGPDAATNP